MIVPVLEVTSVSKTYKNPDKSNLKVLDNISLSLKINEIVSVIGPSACGKSTLLDSIAGLTGIDSGEIKLNGKSILNTTGQVSYMMQDDVLLPWRNLRQNIRKNFCINKAFRPAKIYGVLSGRIIRRDETKSISFAGLCFRKKYLTPR